MGDLKLKVNISTTFDATDDLVKALKRFTDSEVLVGVPAATIDKGRKAKDRVNNATLAYVHNYGSPVNNIPARPFMEPGVNDARDTNLKLLEAGGKAILDGGTATAQLEAVGIVTQVAIKKRITSNTPPPLAPRTLAARKARGVTRTNTLVDTGALLNSISYVVAKKKK